MSKLSLPPITILASAAAALVEDAGDNRARTNALNKAMLHLHEGLAPVPTVGGFLVESGTRGGLVHRFSTVHGCTCEAGRAAKVCWHAMLIEIIEAAATRYTMPALAVTRPSYADALIAANELYA